MADAPSVALCAVLNVATGASLVPVTVITNEPVVVATPSVTAYVTVTFCVAPCFMLS